MRKLFLVLIALACASAANAGQLRNTMTSPDFEASVTGPDTCAAGSVPQTTTMTILRSWTGVSSGSDSLTGVAPNLPIVMTAGVPNGSYTVTVRARDTAGNISCPFSANFIVRGKPSRINNLGDAMLFPSKLPLLLSMQLASESETVHISAHAISL